jgi:uncharacterized protein (DUF58 family)
MSDSAIDWAAIHSAAISFRLAMPRSPAGGRLGERIGTGTGSSLEFQDYREYTAGDDLRHVDWAAYARSEILTVRLYREEVAPRVDLVFDVSRSMLVTEQKVRAHRELCALLCCAAQATQIDARIITLSSIEPRRLRDPEEIERLLSCDGAISAVQETHLPLRRHSVRVVVSDFLFPHDPDSLVSRLAREAASLSLIQLTLPEEMNPSVLGGWRLVDIEGHGELDVVIDQRAIQDYCARFGRLRLGLSRAARRTGSKFVHLIAGESLRQGALALAAAGVLEVI